MSYNAAKSRSGTRSRVVVFQGYSDAIRRDGRTARRRRLGEAPEMSPRVGRERVFQS